MYSSSTFSKEQRIYSKALPNPNHPADATDEYRASSGRSYEINTNTTEIIGCAAPAGQLHTHTQKQRSKRATSLNIKMQVASGH